MKYKVVFTERAKKELRKQDKPTAALIIGWLEKNIEGCNNPRNYGKPLVGDKSHEWRYRIGNYRAICEIQDAKVIVLVLDVGHRREIYKI